MTVVIAIAGIGLSATNQVSINSTQSLILLLYFVIVAVFEFAVAVFFAILFYKQHGVPDLTALNRKDCTISCLSLMLRFGWTLGLGINNQVYLYR